MIGIAEFSATILLPIVGSVIALYLTVSFFKFTAPDFWFRFAAWENERKVLIRSGESILSYSELTRIFCDLVRKEERNLTILEIGCGGGANLEFFPTGSRLLMLDINPHCEKYLRLNLKKHPHVHLDQFLVASAENLLQLQSGSVDTVVSSRTLCSLDESKALKEIFRVLKQNGKLVIEEHILSESRVWRVVQHFLSIARISETLSFGCKLNKDLIKALGQAGFTNLNFKYIEAGASFSSRLQPYIIGTATKP